MAKESKYSWNDMFKLENLNPVENTEKKEETNPPVVTKTTEDGEEEVVDHTAGIPWKEEEDIVVDETKTETKEKKEVETSTKTEKSPVTKEEPKVVDTNVFTPFMDLIKDGVLSYNEEKEYDNSVEGIKELLQENINKAVDSWKNQYSPEALEVLEHLKNGGSLDELIQLEQAGPDYEKDVDLADETHQKYLIEDWLTEQGFEEEEIKAKLEKYEEAGILEDEAKTAHKKLISTQKKKREQLIEQQKQEVERKKTEALAKADNFKKKVTDTKEIAGFQLKQGEQQKLLDYMTKPVKEGKTQLQLDYDEDTQLKMAYFMMKKFDFKDIENKATTKSTIKIKQQLSKDQDKNLNTKGTVVPADEGETKYTNDVPALPWIKVKQK